MILGILPIYCWIVALFSIPIAIIDILGASSAISSLYYLAAAIPLLF